MKTLWLLLLVACGAPPPSDTFCVPGAERCAQMRYQQCSDDGSGWVDRFDCGAQGEVCVENLGCAPCYPDTRTCDGQDIVRCRPDGSGYDTIATCGQDNDVCSGGDCVEACQLAAETRSYQGCEYWPVDLDNAVVSTFGAASAQQYSVVLSNPGPLQAHITVEIDCDDADAANPAIGCTAGGPATVAEYDLSPGALKIVDLDPREVDGTSSPELNDGPGTFDSHHAYHIVSTAPLIAYQFNPLDNVGVFSNDASLLLPTEALDNRYLVLSWPQTLAVTSDPATNGGIDLRAFLTLVGVNDGTTAQVTLSTDILGGGGIAAAHAGDTITVHLDRFSVVNLETDGFNADFTGTAITATSSIAVYTGSEASDVPRYDTLADRFCCADHLEEQLFPEVSLGTHFVAVKTPSRSAAVAAAGWDVTPIADEPEDWRVLSARDDTLVQTTLPPPDDSFTLQRGESRIFDSERDFTLVASGPVSFAQFPVSQLATGIPSTLPGGERPPGGDPSSIMIPPLEQWRADYLFLVPNKYAFDYLLIAAPSNAHLRYDHVPLEDALDCASEPIGTLGDVEYLALRCPLSHPTPDGPGQQDDGVHLLESDDGLPFGLVLWGWDSFVSYGYPGGSNLLPINLN